MIAERGRTLVLARHSLPEIAPRLPSRQWRLSDEGRRRAEILGRRLAAYAPDLLVSSDEPKAIETARIAARALGVPAGIAPLLHEHERGGVPYLSELEFEMSLARLFREPDRLVFGEETANEARSRAADAIARTVGAHPGETLALVTHATVLTLVVAEANALEPLDFWKKLSLPSFAVLQLPAMRLIRLVETVA